MTITTQQNTDATAAVAALQTAITTFDAFHDPAAQDLFSQTQLAPINTANASLAANLGTTLLGEQLAAGHAGIAPLALSTVEENRLVNELGKPRQLRGWIKQVTTDRVNERSVAGCIVSILQAVQAVASVV